MSRVLFAESAIFIEFESVGSRLSVFIRVVITLFAFGASKHYLDSVSFLRCHIRRLLFVGTKYALFGVFRTQKITPHTRVLNYDNINPQRRQPI